MLYFPKQKKLMRRVADMFMNLFIECSWILISISVFNFLQHVVLIEAYEEYLALHRKVFRKGNNILCFLQPFKIIMYIL